MKAGIILVLSLIVMAVGMLFALQGAGIVHWPAQSFMVGRRDWIEYGIVIMLIGIALLLTARKIHRS